MNMMLFAIAGGVIGWALTVLMPRGHRLHVVVGVMMGIAGALLSGWLLVPLFHRSVANDNDIAITASLVSVLGAAVSLGLVSLARRGIRRSSIER
jgi:uncharacterized membrane protein YeaQ/YmgE (transglycosylase-associated protein family)